jgi:hypothetical protein
MLVVVGVLLATFAGISPLQGAEQGKWEFFQINAQYRGTVKQAFEELGCGLAYFVDLADGRKQVFMHSCVKDPEKKGKYYSYRVNLVYSVNAGRIQTASEIYTWFEGFEPENQSQLKDMLLFLGLVKNGLFPTSGETMLQINQSQVKVGAKLLSGGKKAELEVLRPGKPPLEGKFFLDTEGPNLWRLSKYRFKRGKISVSFISVPLADIQQKFQTVAPFDKVVFGK